jgi:hypothetical protein
MTTPCLPISAAQLVCALSPSKNMLALFTIFHLKILIFIGE